MIRKLTMPLQFEFPAHLTVEQFIEPETVNGSLTVNEEVPRRSAVVIHIASTVLRDSAIDRVASPTSRSESSATNVATDHSPVA